jgi:AAA15 family ATPase/GTPase
MITNVEISNYRSIGDKVSLKLRNLTTLVGPNGSGKSNVVDALRFVADALHNGLDAAITNRQGFAALRRRSTSRSSPISIQIDVSQEGGHHGTYLLVLGANKLDGYRIKRELANWFIFYKNQFLKTWFDCRNGKLNSSFRDYRNREAGQDTLALTSIFDSDF